MPHVQRDFNFVSFGCGCFLGPFGYTAAILISVVSNDIFGIIRGQINKYVFAPCVSHNSYLKQPKSKWPHGIYEKVYGVVSDAAVFADKLSS